MQDLVEDRSVRNRNDPLAVAVEAALLFLTGAAFVANSRLTLNQVNRMGNTWESFSSGSATKVTILNDLRGAVGFGGEIHNFKNFVLRMDRLRVIKVQNKIRDLRFFVTRLRGVTSTRLALKAPVTNFLADRGVGVGPAKRDQRFHPKETKR